MDRKQLEEIKRQGKLRAKGVWIETIGTLNEINKIMNDLEFDRDRLSTGGQQALDRYWKLIDKFSANRGGEIKEILNRKD
jgi:hypothetical protein